jgi:hypothetical protein
MTLNTTYYWHINSNKCEGKLQLKQKFIKLPVRSNHEANVHRCSSIRLCGFPRRGRRPDDLHVKMRRLFPVSHSHIYNSKPQSPMARNPTRSSFRNVKAKSPRELAWLPSFAIPVAGRFIMCSVITNIYNKKTKGPNLMELFTATGKLKNWLFLWE